MRQPPGSDINYADLNLPQIEKASGSSRKKAPGSASSLPQAYSGDGDYADTVCAQWGCYGARIRPALASSFEDGFSLTHVGKWVLSKDAAIERLAGRAPVGF